MSRETLPWALFRARLRARVDTLLTMPVGFAALASRLPSIGDSAGLALGGVLGCMIGKRLDRVRRPDADLRRHEPLSGRGVIAVTTLIGAAMAIHVILDLNGLVLRPMLTGALRPAGD